MAKKKNKNKPKPVIKAELSETPVIDGEQVNAPVEADVPSVQTVPVSPSQATQTVKPGHMPRTLADIPTEKRPTVKQKDPWRFNDSPPPAGPPRPVTCAACKGTYSFDTVTPCLLCKGSLVFCPSCAKAGTCHKCGKDLSK